MWSETSLSKHEKVSNKFVEFIPTYYTNSCYSTLLVRFEFYMLSLILFKHPLQNILYTN